MSPLFDDEELTFEVIVIDGQTRFRVTDGKGKSYHGINTVEPLFELLKERRLLNEMTLTNGDETMGEYIAFDGTDLFGFNLTPVQHRIDELEGISNIRGYTPLHKQTGVRWNLKKGDRIAVSGSYKDKKDGMLPIWIAKVQDDYSVNWDSNETIDVRYYEEIEDKPGKYELQLTKEKLEVSSIFCAKREMEVNEVVGATFNNLKCYHIWSYECTMI